MLLAFEPWGHVGHTGVECGCRSSDRTATYVHEVAFDHPTSICAPTALLSHQASSNSGYLFPDPDSYDGVPSVCPDSVPFVSDRAGAYGRLLLATHERMMRGGLVACDWLRPVTWGGVACGSSNQRRGAVCGWCVSIVGSVVVLLLTWVHMLWCALVLSDRSVRFTCVPVSGDSVSYCGFYLQYYVRGVANTIGL